MDEHPTGDGADKAEKLRSTKEKEREEKESGRVLSFLVWLTAWLMLSFQQKPRLQRKRINMVGDIQLEMCNRSKGPKFSRAIRPRNVDVIRDQ